MKKIPTLFKRTFDALANAVCHRDYGQANDIQVKILEDRIVIANPGQLPFDLTLEDLEDPENEGEVAKKVAKNEGEVAKKVAETKAMLADKVSAVEMNIIECILGSPMMSQAAIAGKLGMTRQYIGRCMDELQKRQIVRHVGPKKGGHWELVQTKA